MRGGGAWKKKLQVPVRNTHPTNAATCWHKTGSRVQRLCDVIARGKSPGGSGGAARRKSRTADGVIHTGHWTHWSFTLVIHTAGACRRARKGFAWPMTISAPPSCERRTSNSSMKVRIRKMPRPEVFITFSSARGIGDIGKIQSAALVDDVDDQFLGTDFDDHGDFLMALLFIAVANGVDDSFANRHADLVAVVVVETRPTGRCADRYPRPGSRCRTAFRA